VSAVAAVGSAPSVGTVTVTPAAGSDALPPVCGGYTPPITRTVIVGDTVFSVSDTAVQANALETLAETGRVELR